MMGAAKPQAEPASHEPARQEMVDHQIAARGISDPRVLTAMRRIPREQFVPAGQEHTAYDDRALPIGQGQTISQPYIVGYMTQALRLEPGMKVLEIGTGSGYQTALLAAMGGCVHTIERLQELAEQARHVLENTGLGPVTFHVGDGSLGLPSEAPFDRILVTAAAPTAPRPLLEQLAIGGRLVAPVGGLESQVVICIDRLTGRFVESPGLPCRFVKLIGEQAWLAPPPDDRPSA